MPDDDSASLLGRIRDLEARLRAENAIRYRLATRHNLHPDPERSILDSLPTEIIISILELVLVREEPLMLNQLLTRPREDNVPIRNELPLSIRQPIIGTDWFNMTKGDLPGKITGHFEYNFCGGQHRWAWQPKTGLKEMWDVINTCKVFRREGLKLLLGKNSFVINPVWTLRKAETDRYWCVKVGDYGGPWTGDNGYGEGGLIPVWRSNEFSLPASTWGDEETISSEQLAAALASRPLHKQEYFLIPKALVGLPRPATLIKRVHIGFQICSHIPSDAVHFYKETVSLLTRYKDFETIVQTAIRISASWQCAYQWNWGDWDTKSDTTSSFIDQLQRQKLPGRRCALESDEPALFVTLKPHIKACAGPCIGQASLYDVLIPPVLGDCGPDVIIDREGNVQEVDWEEDSP